jgi:hypothetical protein
MNYKNINNILMFSALQKKLNGNRPIATYFESWSSAWSSIAGSFDLTNLPSPINIVLLAFATPACNYIRGSYSWKGTGLDFSSEFSVVKNSISLLRQRGVVTMLSVGGASYSYDTFNPDNIAALAQDLGVDGIDIDWEPSDGTNSASQLGPIIQQMRSRLCSDTQSPTCLLSIAAFSVGAYVNTFSNGKPTGGPYVGMSAPGLISNGHQLDFINIMSYDASNEYDPTYAFKAYRDLYKGPLLLGFEIPPESWGGHVITLPEVVKHSQFILTDDNKNNGVFTWSYQKAGNPSTIEILKTAKNILHSSPSIIPQWTRGVSYSKGTKIIHNNRIYICNQPNVASNINAPNTVWSPSTP